MVPEKGGSMNRKIVTKVANIRSEHTETRRSVVQANVCVRIVWHDREDEIEFYSISIRSVKARKFTVTRVRQSHLDALFAFLAVLYGDNYYAKIIREMILNHDSGDTTEEITNLL